MSKVLTIKSWFAVLFFTVVSQITLAEEDSTKKIVVVGDSLSAAYNLSSQVGWVKLLSERINERYPNYSVVNASISGATTGTGLQVLPRVLQKHQPSIIVLELGGNDGLQGKPVPYIRQNLQKLIDLSRAAKAKILFVGMQLPPNMGQRYTQPFKEQYPQLAKENNVAFVPFLLEGIAGKADLISEDGIHPKEKAQPLILDVVWPYLETLLAEGNS